MAMVRWGWPCCFTNWSSASSCSEAPCSSAQPGRGGGDAHQGVTLRQQRGALVAMALVRGGRAWPSSRCCEPAAAPLRWPLKAVDGAAWAPTLVDLRRQPAGPERCRGSAGGKQQNEVRITKRPLMPTDTMRPMALAVYGSKPGYRSAHGAAACRRLTTASVSAASLMCSLGEPAVERGGVPGPAWSSAATWGRCGQRWC